MTEKINRQLEKDRLLSAYDKIYRGFCLNKKDIEVKALRYKIPLMG